MQERPLVQHRAALCADFMAQRPTRQCRPVLRMLRVLPLQDSHRGMRSWLCSHFSQPRGRAVIRPRGCSYRSELAAAWVACLQSANSRELGIFSTSISLKLEERCRNWRLDDSGLGAVVHSMLM